MIKFSVLVSTLFFVWHIGRDALRYWRGDDVWLAFVNTAFVLLWLALMGRLMVSDIIPPTTGNTPPPPPTPPTNAKQ